MSRTCFQVNWSMCEVPKVVPFSRSILESAPSGSSFRKKVLGRPVMMWKCFESGSRLSMNRIRRLWPHQPTSESTVAPPAPSGSTLASIDATGVQPRSAATCATSGYVM